MSERAIGIAEVERQSTVAIPARVLRRVYVPLATLLFVFLVGSWLVYEAEPLTATPPEQRKETGLNPELSPQEAAMAHAVIEPGFASRGGREQLLFMGNSQTMAIPYAQSWDISTPQWFQVLMSRRHPGAVDVHRGSLGGLTMVETLVRVIDFGESVGRPASAIIAIHPELINRLSMRDEVREESQKPAVANQLRSVSSDGESTSAAHVLNTLTVSEQAMQSTTTNATPWPTRLEDFLQSRAETNSLFANREDILDFADIVFRKYRNRIFHVTSASPRPLENSTYATNLSFLKMTLEYTQAHEINVVLYFGPLRSLQPNPDSKADIDRMHRDVSLIAADYNAKLLDYGDLIPEKDWAVYEPSRLNELTGDAGQPDFAHFRAEAHRTLAQSLVNDAGEDLAKSMQ